MLNYLIRRLLLMIPTLFGITLVVFVVMAAAPGGITAQTLVDGMELEPESRQALEAYYNKLYGLDQPAPVQYLRWLNSISPIGFEQQADGSLGSFSLWKGVDLGTSFRYGRPVTTMLEERLPITLLLNVISIPLIYALAVGIGVQAARQRGGRFDVGSNIFLLGLWSVPSMLAGVLFIGFFASEQYWRWFPTAGLMQRETVSETFLPLYASFSEVTLVFICVAGLVVGLMQLLSRLPVSGRQWLGMLIGLGLGWLMAHDLNAAWLSGLHVGLMLVIGLLFRLLFGLDNMVLRFSLAGGLGVGAGLVLAGILGVQAIQNGYLLDRIWHLVLPVIALSYGGLAFLAKLTRSALLENLAADYARTARAKGVDENAVLWRHVFRNSLLPLITVSATLLPSLLAGSVIIESIFSIDGMGKLAVEAVQTRDRELVLSVTLISGLLTLVGYLLADIAYAMVDPRVSYE
ncbi:Oligopeptide transport system permease protein OppB [Methylophaga frappieri]|uniref:Oligopeptide transport system permease protein OppB n=1 Tax=Methylophaga frappieri (strain ATCC BAA-2434 / DSM 25690 / JAM7) TaxID=754477 RepID=I1YL71_METFJ|nr:ABC transporter permease [Methylophaga frappieri]AFJ03664.1 Oligopeptide transport system permease protein OppB [Methylophaga frappieri]